MWRFFERLKNVFRQLKGSKSRNYMASLYSTFLVHFKNVSWEENLRSLSFLSSFLSAVLWTEARSWLKEYLEPVSVFVGLPLILPCNPPVGPPRPQTYWMNSCEHQLPPLWKDNGTVKLTTVPSHFKQALKRSGKVHWTPFSLLSFCLPSDGPDPTGP